MFATGVEYLVNPSGAFFPLVRAPCALKSFSGRKSYGRACPLVFLGISSSYYNRKSYGAGVGGAPSSRKLCFFTSVGYCKSYGDQLVADGMDRLPHLLISWRTDVFIFLINREGPSVGEFADYLYIRSRGHRLNYNIAKFKIPSDL